MWNLFQPKSSKSFEANQHPNKAVCKLRHLYKTCNVNLFLTKGTTKPDVFDFVLKGFNWFYVETFNYSNHSISG